MPKYQASAITENGGLVKLREKCNIILCVVTVKKTKRAVGFINRLEQYLNILWLNISFDIAIKCQDLQQSINLVIQAHVIILYDFPNRRLSPVKSHPSSSLFSDTH